MAQDYFTVLGLSPGRYDPAEITRRFRVRRAELLAELDNPAQYAQARRALDELHLAYAALRGPRAPDSHLRRRAADRSPVQELRDLIAASLEDGLLRYSRRRGILERARELGLSDFQAQLLIAQTQFGEREFSTAVRTPVTVRAPASRTWVRLAGAGVLAAAIFVLLVRWVNG